MSEPATIADLAATPTTIPQRTNSPLHQPIAPPGPGSAQPLKSPSAFQMAQMSASERAAHDMAELDRQSKGGQNFVHTRNSDGTVTITDRATGRPVDGDAPAGDQTAPAAAQGTKIQVGEFQITAEELGALMARQAQDDFRRASVPLTPADYKVALPEGLTLPGNAEYRFDEAGNKASFDAAKAWAHQRGMSQADFSEMMGLYASHHAAQEARIAEVARAELQKAGPNAGMRVDSISRWIRAEVGDADARPIIATLATNAHLKFYEKILTKITNQGTATFDNRHRDRGPEAGTVSDAEWATMSDAAKLDYARSHSGSERR
jgi:hypothetical protein